MLVFVVIYRFLHSLENIIVEHVEKHFVQLVCVWFVFFFIFHYMTFILGSSKSSPLFEFGVEDEVRVCESCYDRLIT